SKYATYPEYHTSLDDLSLMTEAGLQGAYETLLAAIQCLEQNRTYIANSIGEPQMGKRNLYPTLARKQTTRSARMRVDILTYCDGEHDLLDIANLLDRPVWELAEEVQTLLENDLLRLLPS
ncbi:MAG: DUF4910 domain-containing protein, partial [Prosthecobacter sp.]|nr:DUF4910 domain-containing protein [Prosthecobacter sp.]